MSNQASGEWRELDAFLNDVFADLEAGRRVASAASGDDEIRVDVVDEELFEEPGDATVVVTDLAEILGFEEAEEVTKVSRDPLAEALGRNEVTTAVYPAFDPEEWAWRQDMRCRARGLVPW